jgi:polyisoprenoid-binding protein YceI
MKNTVRFIMMVIFLYAPSLNAQSLVLSEKSSVISFNIKNFGLSVHGNFTSFNGNIIFNEDKPETSQFDITIQANSINTGIGLRDKHLCKQQYFDTDTYPVIRFISKNVKKTSDPDIYLITGKLILKNVNKELSFPFKASPTAHGYLFSAALDINRRQFMVGEESIGMGDIVNITINATATSNNDL